MSMYDALKAPLDSSLGILFFDHHYPPRPRYREMTVKWLSRREAVNLVQHVPGLPDFRGYDSPTARADGLYSLNRKFQRLLRCVEQGRNRLQKRWNIGRREFEGVKIEIRLKSVRLQKVIESDFEAVRSREIHGIDD